MASLSPHLDPPNHLASYADTLDSLIGSGRYVAFSAPPQHGKTITTAHALISWASNHKGLCHAYAAYNHDRALEVLDQVKALAFDAGLDPHTRSGLLTLSGGTEIKFTGIGGSLTGRPISGVLVIDDPIKGPTEASSPRYRERAWQWLSTVGHTRQHPGSPAVLMQTRWHPDDMAGKAIAAGWESIRLAAICDDEAGDAAGRTLGQALWPHRRPIDWLEKKKRELGAYDFEALYQGRPRPKGSEVFGPPSYYSELPKSRYTYGYGLDLAYTARTSADYSVMVQLLRAQDGTIYVTDILRRQCPVPEFAEAMRAQLDRKPGRVRWYCSTTERGLADFMRESVRGLPIDGLLAKGDKLTRAQRTAAAWNAGKVLLPDPSEWDVPWVAEAVDEITAFTGLDDPHDDIVDALAAGYDSMAQGGSKRSIFRLAQSAPEARI